MRLTGTSDIVDLLDNMDVGHVIIYKTQNRLNVVSLPIPLPFGQVTTYMQNDSIVRVTQTTSWKPDHITTSRTDVTFTGGLAENGA